MLHVFTRGEGAGLEAEIPGLALSSSGTGSNIKPHWEFYRPRDTGFHSPHSPSLCYVRQLPSPPSLLARRQSCPPHSCPPESQEPLAGGPQPLAWLRVISTQCAGTWSLAATVPPTGCSSVMDQRVHGRAAAAGRRIQTLIEKRGICWVRRPAAGARTLRGRMKPLAGRVQREPAPPALRISGMSQRGFLGDFSAGNNPRSRD